MKIYWSVFLSVCGLLILSSCEQSVDQPLNSQQISSFLEDRYFDTNLLDNSIPDFEYQLLSGEKEKLSDNKGKIVLLNFWATWCVPCKVEMPDLEVLSHKLKSKDFRLLAISSGDSPEKISEFLKENPYSFDVAIDENRKITHTLKVYGLPTTYILSKDLKILGKIMGPTDWKNSDFILFLQRLANF